MSLARMAARRTRSNMSADSFLHFLDCARFGLPLWEQRLVYILRGESAGAAHNDLAPFFRPFQDRSPADPELAPPSAGTKTWPRDVSLECAKTIAFLW